MPKKTLLKFFIDPDQHQLLIALKERDGIPVAEQIRRGIDLWLASRETVPKQKGGKPSGKQR